MSGNDNLGDELMRLTQALVVEGNKFVAAFAGLHRLHHTDVEALGRVMMAEDQGAPMTAGTLGAELGLTSGATTALVDRLERAGHIRRARDGADRRKVYVHYSATGRALADDFFGPLLDRGEDAMAQFTAQELDVVRRFLTTTVAGMVANRQSLTGR